MLLLSLLISGLSGPVSAEPPVPRALGPAEIYAPPVVRPYEPPSSFGRQIAEGDADASVRTRPLTAPVAVEAYRETYEPNRSPRELSYEQGVEAARISQNARMGPLDGVWTVIDGQGQPILDLVLSDRGGARPVEGGLRLARTDRTALIDSVTVEGDTRILAAVLDGHPVSLRLRPQAEGWSGELTGTGPQQTVSLIRQP
jgi:hypothetical protein